MAKFTDESTAMKFALTVDDSKKTVSVSKISPSATADKLSAVAESFKPLFVSTPTKVTRSNVEIIESE